MNKKQNGFIHIVFFVIVLIVIVSLVLVWLHIQSAKTTKALPASSTQVQPAASTTEPVSIASNTVLHSHISIWSGYVTDSTIFQAVEGRIKVPVVMCDNDQQAFGAWVGFDGLNTGTVEQTGFTASCASAANYSKNPPVNGVYYYAWSLMYGSDTGGMPVFDIAIKPGDVIDYKVTYTDSKYNMTVTDLTTNQTQTDSETCHMSEATVESKRGGCTQNSVEWIVERAGDSQLAKFDPVQLYDNTATDNQGNTRYIEDYTNQRYDMVNNSGLLLAQTSQLGAKGTFNITWEASGDIGE